jgi:DNA topoisomerase-3
VCQGRIFETMMSYACENTFGETPTCKMKVGKVILSQAIDRVQMEKLITAKKTDLLTAFVSQRTRRKFSAYLVMADDGKTSFAFEPRKEGAGKKPFGRRNFPAKAAAPAGEGAEAKSVPAVAKPKKSRAKKVAEPAE